MKHSIKQTLRMLGFGTHFYITDVHQEGYIICCERCNDRSYGLFIAYKELMISHVCPKCYVKITCPKKLERT